MVFKESTAAHIIEKAEKDVLDLGGKIVQRYNTVFKGFAALIPTPIIQALSTNPDIDYIEEDSESKEPSPNTLLQELVLDETFFFKKNSLGRMRVEREAHRTNCFDLLRLFSLSFYPLPNGPSIYDSERLWNLSGIDKRATILNCRHLSSPLFAFSYTDTTPTHPVASTTDGSLCPSFSTFYYLYTG